MPSIYHNAVGFLAILGLASQAIASPLVSPVRSSMTAARSKRANNFPETGRCDSDQVDELKKSWDDLSFLVVFADGTLSNDWEKKKGYTHYFKGGDHDRVADGFKGLLGLSSGNSEVRFKFDCGTQDECGGKGSGRFASTNATPEDFEAPDAKPPTTKGIRTVLMCPLFFEDARTKRHLPGPFPENNGKEEYCRLKESKRLVDFESGGHTLLHEITHLDQFGVAAGYPEETSPAVPNFPSYKFHGTIDWQGKSTAANARTLKKSKAKNRPETWQNAEGFPAMATELLAGEICEISDIND